VLVIRGSQRIKNCFEYLNNHAEPLEELALAIISIVEFPGVQALALVGVFLLQKTITGHVLLLDCTLSLVSACSSSLQFNLQTEILLAQNHCARFTTRIHNFSQVLSHP